MGLKELKKNKRISLGDKLRRRRISYGFKNQEEFAHKIGSNRVTVSRWESGTSGIGEQFHDAIKEVLEVDDSFFDQPPAPALVTLATKAYAEVHSVNETIGRIVGALPFMSQEELAAILAIVDQATGRRP